MDHNISTFCSKYSVQSTRSWQRRQAQKQTRPHSRGTILMPRPVLMRSRSL